MTDSSVTLYLIIATFAAVLVYAIVQIFKVRKAKRTHQASAMTESSRREGPAIERVGEGLGVKPPGR